MNKKFWATTFTLTGTIIGAGILGLPYVFAESGFLIGLFWLILLGIIIILSNLYLGEVCLRTKERHQLTGLAKKYLGKTASRIMFFAVIFGIYSALIAYLIGEGESFSQLIFGTTKYAFYLAMAFWIIMTLLLKEGLKGLKKIETWGVIAIILIVIGIFVWFSPQIHLQNLTTFNPPKLFFPIGVVLFALLGFTSIPELKMEIKGKEKLLKKAIIIGTIIPIVLYILFSVVFVGVLDKKVSEVATLSFGPLITILGIFTMLTSYLVLSFSLKDTFKYDLKFSKLNSFIGVSLLPALIYTAVYILKLDSFVTILGIGGVISGGLTGILILAMNYKSKKFGNRKPEFKIPINKLILIILSIIFVLGIITELLI